MSEGEKEKEKEKEKKKKKMNEEEYNCGEKIEKRQHEKIEKSKANGGE